MPVRYEPQGHVGVVRLDGGRLNVLSRALLDELSGLVASLGADPPRALVLWGGAAHFAAGAEVAELADPARAPGLLDAFRRACDGLAGFPRPTLAAVAGYALGGGLELALACDLRFAAAGARLGLPEVTLGIIPGAGGTQRLARLVGPARAKELIFTGRHVPAAEALAMGLVDRVVDDGALLEEALSFTGRLATGAVLAQSLAKRAVDAGLGRPIAEGLDIERAAMDEVLATQDAARGMAAFLERRRGEVRFAGQ